jgi:eukaryotic-like serine/threonine-protein kinase
VALERWERVTDLFADALERPAAERYSYLKKACADDIALLAEVAELVRHYESAGDFLENPVIAIRPVLSTGQMLNGRYLIEALLGRGGMGEVYRANDELVGEKVALKTLRLDIPDKVAMLRRFQREVQLARKVTHSAVCRVFEVGTHAPGTPGEVHFFTMQLLEGETLAARIRRGGPLARSEALDVAIQVAAGLDAAHAAGVIHRDFKSSNVMMRGEHAVIMDFGLARFEAADRARGNGAPSATIGTQIAGTIAYMSPEQLGGEPLTISSDLYSFGVVLFEMVTGRLPFDEKHIIRSAMERASDATLNVRRLAPQIDAQWAVVIERCLKRDPAKRFGTAGEIARALRPRWRAPSAYWSRRDWAKAVVAVAAVSGVALLPLTFRLYGRGTALVPGAEVLLGSIDNLTNDESLDAVTELFRNQLAQSAHVSVIEGGRIVDTVRRMGVANDAPVDADTLREAAWRLNAALSVYGTLARVGSDYVLSIQLETRGSEPANPRTKALRSFAASNPSALMQAVRTASNWVREEIGESARSIASFDRLPEDATTTSWRALAHYARGQRHFMNQEFNPAIDKFAEALTEDPRFALAALRRADLLVTQTRQTEGFEQYRIAMGLLEERQVTRPEELYGRGMFALDSGDFETADRHFRTWSAEYPFDWRAPFYRMIPLCMNGHAAQALDLLKGLVPVLPDYGDLCVQICRVHIVLGQTAAARELLPEIRRLNRAERGDMHEATIRFREGDCVGCLSMLRNVQRSSYRRLAAEAMIQEGLLLIDAGYSEAAAANVTRFLASGSWVEARPQQVALQLVVAWAEMLAGRRAAAVENARRALSSESGALIAALAGTVFARSHEEQAARAAVALCERFEDLTLYRFAKHRVLGELARSVGDDDLAIAELRSAAALEPAIAHRQYLIEALPPGSPERAQLAADALRTPWQNLRPPPMHHIGALGIAVAESAATGHAEPFAQAFLESTKRLEPLL